MQLRCPVCGQYPVMSPVTRVFLNYRQEYRCVICNTALSNPSWFDILRIFTWLGFSILLIYHVNSYYLCLFTSVIYFVAIGLIALFFIPLQEHWNVTDKK